MYYLKTNTIELKTTSPDVIVAVMAVQEKKEGEKEYLPSVKTRKNKSIRTARIWTRNDFEYLANHLDDDKVEMANQLGRTIASVATMMAKIRNPHLLAPGHVRWLERMTKSNN